MLDEQNQRPYIIIKDSLQINGHVGCLRFVQIIFLIGP